MQDRKRARELAAEFSRKDDPTGWFDVLYREAEEGKSTVPWADYHPTPVIGFWMQYPQQAAGKSALVAGCGLGAAAAQHARWGFCTTGFDISETAIRNARKRFPPFPSGLSDRRSAASSRALARPVRFCFRNEHAPGLARRASS